MRKWIFLTLIGSLAFANEGTTDIIPRTINFLIFAAILWYLIGDKVKEFFRERRENIAQKFQTIEDKLKESKAKKEALKAQLQEARKLAEDIVQTAKEEAALIEGKVKTQLEEELALLEKHFEDYKKTEIRKNKEAVIKAFMNEVLKDVHITSEDAAKLVLKVA
ncbi:MAG: F0F1 ATP synthase subunit B [Epsilonproteobacteria bacterium]|jgi:F-type H+-transporting ATPase subunit b|nr:F0F1 ATP synthase subunit B [Campylobacterota bacterium]